MKWVTVRKASDLSGYSEDAIRTKIADGTWVEGKVWRRAPDNRILISTDTTNGRKGGSLYRSGSVGPRWGNGREPQKAAVGRQDDGADRFGIDRGARPRVDRGRG
jgi:hypothetical protein